MQIGVREFKARLSEYLERVARGERLVITSRGKGVAVVTPMPGRGAVDRGIAEGWIRAGDGRPPAAVTPTRARPGALDSAELIRRDRDR